MSPKIDLGSLDLDLMLVFDAIMTDGNLTKAARRLGVGQPTVSNSLARLRTIFNDPLFERTGHGVQPTPRARELVGPIGVAIDALRLAAAGSQDFKPASVDRTFILEVRSDFEALLAPVLLERMRLEAPRARLHISGSKFGTVMRDLGHGSPELAVDAETCTLPSVQSDRLVEHQRAVLARKSHAAIAGKLTREVYARLEHLTLAKAGPEGKGSLTAALEAEGVFRKRSVTIANMAVMCELIRGSDMVATLGRPVAVKLAHQYGLDVFDMPFDVPPLRYHLLWHRRYDSDAAHAWLRSMVKSLSEKL